MPFASINPINPRANLWNFHEIFLRIGDFEKLSFFESAILNFFFFVCFLWKSVKGSWISRMGQNFNDYPGFQAKITPPNISAGSVGMKAFLVFFSFFSTFVSKFMTWQNNITNEAKWKEKRHCLMQREIILMRFWYLCCVKE